MAENPYFKTVRSVFAAVPALWTGALDLTQGPAFAKLRLAAVQRSR
jgi:hypothetical protein